MMRWIGRFLLLCIAVGIAAGCVIGNMAFQEFRTASWDRVLGIENHSNDVSTIRQLEKENEWEPVRINGTDNTILRGTYIEDSGNSHRTVILLHGLYQNRAMCIPYLSIYRNMGYNVLLIDQRGHGESGGHTDWGMSEEDDIAQWVQWLKERDESMKIGLHGVSLGAAMAILYAGHRGDDISFVVADSAYGNMIDLGRDKLRQAAHDERIVWGYNVLDVFFQGAMLFHTHKVISDIEPAEAVRSITAPILFLHGDRDMLVPVQTVHSLYDNCSSHDKDMYIFDDSPHAVGIETNRDTYRRVVTRFLQKIHAE